MLFPFNSLLGLLVRRYILRGTSKALEVVKTAFDLLSCSQPLVLLNEIGCSSLEYGLVKMRVQGRQDPTYDNYAEQGGSVSFDAWQGRISWSNLHQG